MALTGSHWLSLALMRARDMALRLSRPLRGRERESHRTQRGGKDLGMTTRVPTDEEYSAFDGVHCHGIWKTLDEDWTCPVCGRTKRQIMKWKTDRWTCGVHRHHDHNSAMDCTIMRRVGQRFPETVICGACNFLDARVKRVLRIYGLFSFSPDELRSFLD